jgi:hypothetical protein
MGYYTMQQEKTVPAKYCFRQCRNYPEKRHCLALEHTVRRSRRSQNIRNFMKSGWDGAFGEALQKNNQEVTIIYNICAGQ